MKNDDIKYFVYARKSTEPEGRQVLSIPGQLQDIGQLTLRERLQVAETIIETRSAATPFNRPAYADMIKSLKKGKASGIIVWSIDRLARNELEAGELKYLLQIGVIKSIWTMNREYRSIDNNLLIGLETSMATQYSRDLAEKVKRGLYQKCDAGIPPLMAKLGYLNTKFAEHGSNYVKEDPERWHLVRKAFDMVLSKQYSVAQIATILSTEYGLCTRPTKTKPGKPIYKTMLYKMFIDPFYYGYFMYNNSLYKGSYKPMITVEEYDEIQCILGRKTRPRRKKHDFPFTGLMTCGACGCAITATEKRKMIKSTGAEKAYLFYHCTKRRNAENCTEKRYLKAERLEQMIEAELAAYTVEPAFMEWAVQFLKNNDKHEAEKQVLLLNEAKEAEQKLVRELDALIDMRIGGHITEQQYLSKKGEKDALLIRLQAKTKQLDECNLGSTNYLIQKMEYAANALFNFQNGDWNLQKEICLNFGGNWRLKDQKLFIDKPKWLEAIKKYDDGATTLFGRSEPKKTFEKYGEKVSWTMLERLLSSLVNEVGNICPIDQTGYRKPDNNKGAF